LRDHETEFNPLPHSWLMMAISLQATIDGVALTSGGRSGAEHHVGLQYENDVNPMKIVTIDLTKL
jgi:hypothetical protein